VHVTTVFVTHDQEEAMEVSDEIVVMNHGKVEQVGSPKDLYDNEDLYDNPASLFVMSFIDPVNVLPSTAQIFSSHGYNSDSSQVFLRPHDVQVELTLAAATVPAFVKRVIHLRWEVQAELTLEDGHSFTVHLTREQIVVTTSPISF
jgi:sulfate transport system ATP-binding protein